MDIGAYGVTFKVRSHYIWRTAQDCEGYIIRKENWINLMEPGSNLDKDASKFEI
jgi:hypothetical protein